MKESKMKREEREEVVELVEVFNKKLREFNKKFMNDEGDEIDENFFYVGCDFVLYRG